MKAIFKLKKNDKDFGTLTYESIHEEAFEGLLHFIKILKHNPYLGWSVTVYYDETDVSQAPITP